MKYNRFDLTVVGTGRADFQTALTNRDYWNGWGTDNYSAFVRDNIGGEYPRLSYDKASNNFQKSTFWLVNGGFFKIQNVEAGYNFPTKGKSAISGARIYIRGANLLTISKVKDVDPESINSGVTTYPLYKTFTAGLKFTF